ncbi:class F sortase [Tomitella fengzijianii]|uniref:class F sortase n=1 Tax=Tomitella fengzijianii TaxID=2597660 RepID=UPI00131B4AF2|nr:class F sortase [Tomitella fengzijianii]
MTDRQGRRRAAAVAAVLLAAIGIAAAAVGATLQESPPQPPAAVASVAAPSSTASPTRPAPVTPAPAAPVPAPVAIDVPAIGVHHTLMRLGRNPDGTLQVPPLDQVDVPGWDTLSPEPGAPGPAIIVGHVDSAEQGEGVFFDLGALRPGDTVDVTRADGTVAVFDITEVRQFAKAEFPTLRVYGNTEAPELRLITCGGAFDTQSRDYEDNIVVFASLVDTRPR